MPSVITWLVLGLGLQVLSPTSRSDDLIKDFDNDMMQHLAEVQDLLNSAIS